MSDFRETNALLSELLGEVRDLRTDLSGFTTRLQIYDLDDIHSLVSDIKDKLEDLNDAISGSTMGTGGASLNDVCNAIEALQASIEAEK